MLIMLDYIKEREKQRAIERWENEGGRSARADFRPEAYEQERRDVRPLREDTSERAGEIEA